MDVKAREHVTGRNLRAASLPSQPGSESLSQTEMALG